MIKGKYTNIIDLAIKNNVYAAWTNEVDNGKGRTLEDYLDEYSDRDIVTSFISDMTQNVKVKVHKVWDNGCLDWANTEVEVI